MATSKKHPIAVNIVSPGDGVFAEQLNYGDSTGSVISVSDVIMRHIEDYNAKFIPNRIYSNSLTNPSGLTFRLNDGAYATINGRWLKVAGDTDITLSGDNTHYIYLQISDDGGSETTRIPESDTFALTSATSYTETQENLLLAKVVVSGGAVDTFTNYYDSYGSAHLRASAIKPVSSTITMFGGALESATPVAQYSSNYLTFFDDAFLAFGTDKDSKIKFNTSNSKLEFTIPSAGLAITGGAITTADAITATGTVTAGGFTTTGTWTFDNNDSGTTGITLVQVGGTTFSDDDTSLMTAAAINDRIEDRVATENELSEMNDVILTNPANGDLLQYGGSNWINSTSFPGQYAFTNSTGTTLDITNGTGFEIDFTGDTTTNIRSKRDMHLLAQAGYGINLGSNNTADVLVVASDGDVDMSGGLNVTGTVSAGAISTSGDIDLNGNTITDFGAIEFYTFTNNTVSTSNGIISGTITGNTFTSSSTMITISAGTLQKIKLKSGTIGNVDVTTNSYIPTSYPHNFEFKLQINNGSGWEDYSSTSTYSISSGTPTFNNLTLNSSISSYNNSDAFGDDILIRIQARSTKAEVGFNTDADYNFDLTTAISYALATRAEVYYSFNRI